MGLHIGWWRATMEVNGKTQVTKEEMFLSPLFDDENIV